MQYKIEQLEIEQQKRIEQNLQRCMAFYNLKPQLGFEHNFGVSVSVDRDRILLTSPGISSSGKRSVYSPELYQITFKANEINIKYTVSGFNLYENYEFQYDYDLTFQGNKLINSNVHTVWTEDGHASITDKEAVNKNKQEFILGDIIKLIKPIENLVQSRSLASNKLAFFNAAESAKFAPSSTSEEKTAPQP